MVKPKSVKPKSVIPRGKQSKPMDMESVLMGGLPKPGAGLNKRGMPPGKTLGRSTPFKKKGK